MLRTDVWRRVAGPFKEFGIVAGLLYLVRRVLNAVSSRMDLQFYEFMAQPITDKPMLSANFTKNLRFAEINKGDPAIALMPARDDIKAQRFEQGARCLGVYRKDSLIGYLWICFDRYEEDEVRCTYELTVPERSVFDFDLYVFPEHRMGIGFMAVWHGANEFLRERGVQWTFSRLTRFNTASRRAHAHLGWRHVGKALFLQLWRVELMAANVAPYAACTWARRTRLRLAPPPAAQGAPAAAQPAADKPKLEG